MKIKSLSIFIFLYNEVDNLKKLIESVACFLKENVEDGELIIINDGSTDGSLELLLELQKSYIFQLINHDINLGIGSALKNGYNQSTKEFIVGIPGDGQFDIAELLLIKKWDNQTFYSFYREEKNYNWYRSLLTAFNKFLIRNFLKNKLKDVNWIKVYSKKQLLSTNPQLKSSLIESEISSKLIKKGYTFEELPSNYYPRTSGKPKGGNIFTVSKALLEMLKLIRIVRKFKTT